MLTNKNSAFQQAFKDKGIGCFQAFRLCLLTVAITFFVANNLNAQGVGINSSGNAPDPSALLDINSSPENNKGLLIPRLTTTERNSIASPAEGLQIFNTTTKCHETYAYDIWQTTWCATCPSPAAPTTGIHTPSPTQIVWNWNNVPGAAGYKWNTTNNYNTATDNATNTNFTQTGLVCSTSYTLYLWAYSSCGGNSLVTTLTQTTSVCPCHYPGELYGGGVVFYVDGSCLHGLILATADQGVSAWSSVTNVSVPGNATSPTDGVGNTNKIVAQSSNSAAALCKNYNGGGYTDWYQPSRDELNQVWSQWSALNLQGLYGVYGYYWSSTEYDASNAWFQGLFNGIQYNTPYGKTPQHNVRAIRQF